MAQDTHYQSGTKATMFCKVIKLSNGETIIGSITDEDKNFILVEKPIKSEIVTNKEGMFRVMLVKWDPTIDFEVPVKIFKENIVSVGEPTQEFLNSYMEVYNMKPAEAEEPKDSLPEDLNKIEEIIRTLSQLSSNTTIH